MSNTKLENFHPFLGRLVVEVIRETGHEYLDKSFKAEMTAKGVSEDFLQKFEVVRDNVGRTGITRGRIVKMASDCFGEEFQRRFGHEREYPQIGDIVMFVPNKSYQIDAENKYHIIDDCEIVAFITEA